MIQQNLFETEKAGGNLLLGAGPFTPDLKVYALSWKQPYLNLMLPPHFKKETRTWPTKYRGWVMMCSSQTSYKTQNILNISGTSQFYRIQEALKGQEAEMHKNRGYALAIGRLVDCHPMRKEDEDICFVEYHPDLFCHVYEDVQAIEPIKWKGSQGWREVSPEVKAKIHVLRACA